MVCSAEAVVDEAVVPHAHENASRSGDAGQRAGEHADESTEVDEGAEEVDARECCESAHGRGGFAEVLVGGVHAEGF